MHEKGEGFPKPNQPETVVLEAGEHQIEQITFSKEEIGKVLRMTISEMHFSDKLSKKITLFSERIDKPLNTIGDVVMYTEEQLNKNKTKLGTLDRKDLGELGEMITILNKHYFNGQEELHLGMSTHSYEVQ